MHIEIPKLNIFIHCQISNQINKHNFFAIIIFIFVAFLLLKENHIISN